VLYTSVRFIIQTLNKERRYYSLSVGLIIRQCAIGITKVTATRSVGTLIIAPRL
jgi:hypothetical protein